MESVIRLNREIFVNMLLALLLVASSLTTAATDWATVLAGEHRSESNRARDSFRNPAQTLEFFGVTPSSVVVEMYPGGGWYTEVLAPVLAKEGTLYAAQFGINYSAYARRAMGSFLTKIGTQDDIYGNVIITEFSPSSSTAMAPDGTADVVLSFRNIHSWIRLNSVERAFMAAYTALKPGGIFGVVQHRSDPGRSLEDMKSSGYVTEAFVIEMAELIGFELVGQSEVNANSRDTKDYENGVWTLPPSYRMGDTDRDKYTAIGESDRMTLKFQKPL